MTEPAKATTPADLEQIKSEIDRAKAVIHEVIVGQTAAIDALFTAILARGHVPTRGAFPASGKTLLVPNLRSRVRAKNGSHPVYARSHACRYLGNDLDRRGSDHARARRFEFRQGPIFAHLVLADEINRATPKTQSALLEAMQEQTVTTMDKTHLLEAPFFVPRYPEPDRDGGYLPFARSSARSLPDENRHTVSFGCRARCHPGLERRSQRAPPPNRSSLAPRLLEMQSLVRAIPVAEHVRDYVVQLVPRDSPGLKWPQRQHPTLRPSRRLTAWARKRYSWPPKFTRVCAGNWSVV